MQRLIALLFCTLLLAGCSGMRLVESQVRSTAAPPAADPAPIEAGARYRFERLPSQTDPVETDSIEAIAEAELAEVGLVRDEAGARYSVQLSTRMDTFYVDDWSRPQLGGLTGSIFIGGRNVGIGMGNMTGMGMRFPPSSQYRHEATLLLRDLKTNQVVFETRATHEGPWSDRYNILRAVLAAALKDFPSPPTGSRRVKVEIPR